MSIPNLIDKIKSKTNIDKMTIMYLLIIIGVGVSSFGLGRISINSGEIVEKSIFIKETQNINNKPLTDEVQYKEKRYVASKNGKMYYSLNCSGASRIKEENQIWFNSQNDAEKSGYTLSSTCK